MRARRKNELYTISLSVFSLARFGQFSPWSQRILACSFADFWKIENKIVPLRRNLKKEYNFYSSLICLMAGGALLGDFLPPCLQSDFLPLPPSFTPFLVAHETSPSIEREREWERLRLWKRGKKGEGAIDLVFRSDRGRGPFPSQTEGGFFFRPLDPPPSLPPPPMALRHSPRSWIERRAFESPFSPPLLNIKGPALGESGGRLILDCFKQLSSLSRCVWAQSSQSVCVS